MSAQKKELTSEEKEALQRVYRKLEGLVTEYVDEAKRDPKQRVEKSDLVFAPLKEAILDNNLNTPFSHYSPDPLVRIQRFEKKLNELLTSKDKLEKNLIKGHKNGTITILGEKLDAYSVASMITIIPAIVRAVYSYNKYGTGKFWKPKSQKIIECAERGLEELHDKGILPPKNSPK